MGYHLHMARKNGDFFHGGGGFDEDPENPLHTRVAELISALTAAKGSKAKPRI